MPVIKMQKVALLAHRSLREQLLEYLQDKGVLEVTAGKEGDDIDHPEVLYQKAEVLFAIDMLKPHASQLTHKRMKRNATTDEIRASALHTDFRSIIDECKKIQERDTALRTQKQQLLALRGQLEPWKHLPVMPEQFDTIVESVHVRIGTCPSSAWEKIQASLEVSCPRTFIESIGDHDGKNHLIALVWKEDLENFEMIVQQHGWTGGVIPQTGKTPQQQLRQISIDLKLIEGNEKEIARILEKLSERVPDLIHLAQYLRWLDEKQLVRSGLDHTEQTIRLNGWMPASAFRSLKEDVEKKFPAAFVLAAEPKEGEEPPVQIYNSNSVAPFEAVTRLYGLPQSHEMDPTLPLSLFFILSFGLCLTDAGYGIVLSLLTGLAIWKFKLQRQNAQLVWLLFYAGIVTFFVSIPFGGWFGVVPSDAPSWMTYVNADGDTRFLGQIWDVQKDVDFFRNLALSIGGIQLLYGMFLAGYWKWIHGKKWEAIAGHFSAHFFVASLALWLFLDISAARYAMIGFGALFVWGQGSGFWLVRPLIGLLSTVSLLISLMSNILSYLRILALGLATGALAFAINQIAGVVSDLLPAIIGIPAYVLILIFGHLTSIALNSLGSFVHSGRLQFIEFFGQFFQGGGKEFSPFRKTIHSIT